MAMKSRTAPRPSPSDCIWLLDSSPDSYAEADPAWAKAARGEIFCKGCGDIVRSYMPRPVQPVLTGMPDPDGSVAVSFKPGFVVFKRAVVELVHEHLHKPIVGSVSVVDNAVLHDTDFVTCYCGKIEKELQIHVGARATYRICEYCARVLPGFQWRKPEHVLRMDVAGRHAFQDAGGWIYVSSHLRQTLDWSRVPDIRFRRMPVFDEALDKLTRPVVPPFPPANSPPPLGGNEG